MLLILHGCMERLVYLYRTDFVTGIAEDRKKERVNL